LERSIARRRREPACAGPEAPSDASAIAVRRDTPATARGARRTHGRCHDSAGARDEERPRQTPSSTRSAPSFSKPQMADTCGQLAPRGTRRTRRRRASGARRAAADERDLAGAGSRTPRSARFRARRKDLLLEALRERNVIPNRIERRLDRFWSRSSRTSRSRRPACRPCESLFAHGTGTPEKSADEGGSRDSHRAR